MQSYAALVVLYLSVFLVGCSKELTRSEAADLIKKTELVNNSTLTVQFSVGRIPAGCINDKNALELVSQAGLVKTTVIEPGIGDPRFVVMGRIIEVALTPKGVEQSHLWVKSPGPYGCNYAWTITTMKSEFVSVTGISTSLPTAVIEYQWRWVPTESGKQLGMKPSQPQTQSQRFQLFDNGWRRVAE